MSADADVMKMLARESQALISRVNGLTKRIERLEQVLGRIIQNIVEAKKKQEQTEETESP